MRKLALFLAAAFSLVACGCGGGGGGSDAPQASALSLSQPVVITAFGDSTQEGVSLISSEAGFTLSPAPAVEAQKQLRAWTGRDDITVRNEGRRGTTSGLLLQGQDGSGKPWAERLQSAGQIVTINHGINENSRPLDEYRATLLDIVRVAQASGKTVVLETPNPLIAGGGTSGAFDLARHAAAVQTVREIAAQTGSTLCDQHQAILDAGLASLEYLTDGVHPNAGLYQFKGRTLAACLLPLIS